ncbi:hypothetical protein CKAH01_02340 [Colletotrichum kahawae]|uniref:Uncharacterized protein n=1 Tax=Colletotrichum kahawae TaxID=34407 RepID=A0AAD9Y076_COLKA|nr:hypothetical protein CKAH01_02340 [Colletotrichum kahawae]
MSDQLTAGKGVALRPTLPPEVFLLIMEAVLDEAESSTASQSWIIELTDCLEDGPMFFLVDDEPADDDFHKLQQSRFLKVRSVSQVNQMTQSMVRNIFSPLPCYSLRLNFAKQALVFPKIDCVLSIIRPYLESVESALRNQSRHVSRFFQSFESAKLLGGWYSLCREPVAEIKCLISMFPKLKVIFMPTYPHKRISASNRNTGHNHDHDELLISSDLSACPFSLGKFDSGPVPSALKLLWEKQIRLVGTASVLQTESEEAISRDQPVVELVQISQGLRARILDPECSLCKV